MRQHLLISVRGKNEALAAARGGAQIADVEYPASALGTPYPLNIATVRDALSKTGFDRTLVSTNIGESQHARSNACQAALGVATAGADIIKFGLAELPLSAAAYLGREITRSVRHWYPKKQLIPAVFVDDDKQRFFNAFGESPQLAERIAADGVLVDTFDKGIGKGLLDYVSTAEIAGWVKKLHRAGREAWVAGSIALSEMPALWGAGVDVICIRGAACKPGSAPGRYAVIAESIVRELVKTIPGRIRR